MAMQKWLNVSMNELFASPRELMLNILRSIEFFRNVLHKMIFTMLPMRQSMLF